MSGSCFFPLRSVIYTFLFCAGICVVHSDFAVAQHTVSLRGRVTTKDGVVIPMGVNLTLETAEGMPVDKRPADASGQFSFEGVRVMNYKLTVTCDGFETSTQEVKLEYGSDQDNLNIYLNPLKSKKVTKFSALLSDEAASRTAAKNFERGESALQKKNFPEARKFFEQALADSPCYARALDELALVDVADNRLTDAEGHFQKAIRCDGAYLDSYSELAQLYNTEKKYPESETILQQAIQRSPDTWQFYDQLGATHYSTGHYKESEQDYLKVRSLNPAPPTSVYAHLANVYLKEKAYDKAYAEMLNYLRFDPNGKFVPSIKRVSKQMETGGLISPSYAPTYNPPTKPQ